MVGKDTGISIVSDSSATSGIPPKPPKRDNSLEINVDSGASGNKRKTLGSFKLRPEVIFAPESDRSWMSCVKIGLVIFNLCIWALGAGITAIGIWIKVDQEFWEIQTNLDLNQFASASTILIIVGVVIMVIAFIGCWGAAASNLILLVIFAVIVGIVLLLEITVMAIIWTAVYKKDFEEDIKLKAKKALLDKQNEAKQHFVNLIQAKLKCCGIDGPEDYTTRDSKTPVPPSCTNQDTGMVYSNGCYKVMVDYLKEKAGIVGGVAVAVFLLQLCTLIFTICLACAIKNTVTNGIL